MPKASQVKKELKKFTSVKGAKTAQWFFKTGPGEYGEGDKFIGVIVPNQRKVAKKFTGLQLSEIQKLLNSQIHEHRQTGLFILVGNFSKATNSKKKKIFNFYLKNAKRVNNWDLVDCSAPYIVGGYLINKPRKILYKLAKSKNLWERRIAILATFPFIRNKNYTDTLKLAKLLLNDSHDLMHKAVGWMLREVGNRDEKVLRGFLDKYAKKMPRVMFRYATEKIEYR